jgi:nucleolar complex protein 3
VSTALQILSGQGEVLNLDPRQFYIQLYRSILELGSNGPTGVETALGCLEKAFKKRHQVSIQRVAAFVKRLSIVNLQLLPAASLAVMATIRTLMHGYPRCEMLLDVDTPTALYQPEVHDPDVCHADATNLWELTLVGVSCLATIFGVILRNPCDHVIESVVCLFSLLEPLPPICCHVW